MAVFADFALNPPEANYYELTAGDHAASTTAAAVAHQGLSDALAAEMAVMGSNTAATAAVGWQGLGGEAMTMTAAEFLSVLGLAVAWLNEAAAAASQIAAAYQVAETGMIPGPVCDTNRVTQAGLVASNIIGQNTPGIIALDTEYFGQFWTQNAALMGGFDAVVAAMLPVLATPPPIAALTGNPAAPMAAAAQSAAQPGIAALQTSTQAMTEAAAGPAGQAGSAQLAQSALPMLSQAGGATQLLGQAPQAVGSLPQLLGQGAGQFAGLLGPLSGAGLGNPAAGEFAAAGTAAATPAGALGSAAGGAAPGVGSGGAPMVSTFARPASSFNPPSAPKLPGAWRVPEEPAPAVGASPAGGGYGGGLYGAPAALGRDGSGQADKAAVRTVQLTGRPASSRGGDHHN